MALTTIDPVSALVVVDLQKGIASLPLAHPVAEVVANAARLATIFRGSGLPVVLVNVTATAPGRTEQKGAKGDRPADWADLLPELDPQPEDHFITKRSWGAFLNTDLEANLRALGVTQVVIAGIATSIGVESTAREAYALGFNVTLATDAMTDMDLAAHENSISKIFPRLGETGTSAEIEEVIRRA
jgi:nicotinamidase-related amidase